MSVKELPDGRFQARWRDSGGRQRAKIFTGRRAAEECERNERVKALSGAAVTTSRKPTVSAYADEWLTGSMHLARGTTETYRRDLDRYILPELGRIRLDKLQAGAVDGFLADELAAGLAPSSVHRHYRTLRRLYAVAMRRGYVARNPLDLVAPPKVDAAEMRFLTIEELDRLIAATRARWAAMVAVAGWCGLRYGELLGLRRRDIDGQAITVAGQLVRRANGEWERAAPKTAAGRRTVNAPLSIARTLRIHLETYVSVAPSSPVFAQNNGAPPPSSSFHGNIWTPALRRAGLRLSAADERDPAVPALELPAPRFHDLRHTAVALAIAAGAHPKAIQSRMGHSSIAVTLDRYGHLFPEMDATIATNLEALRQPSAAA